MKGVNRVIRGLESVDVVVFGGGSFGTALASALAQLQRRVLLWVRRVEQAEEINQFHTNQTFFPQLSLPKNLRATTDLLGAVSLAPVLILAIPTVGFREVARRIGEVLEGNQLLIHVTKGIEQKTYKRMSQILREETCALKIGAMAGPNLAKEMMVGQPSGALVASHYDEVVQCVQGLFRGGSFRVYGGHDLIGTEIGGAFKNIVAVASGLLAGLAYGDNARALLITRGLAEMANYGVAMGADLMTFGGLAGIGDLMATCTSPLSRNYQVGYRLAQGDSLRQIQKDRNQVAEGILTSKAVFEQSRERRLRLPLVEAVYHLLYRRWTPQKFLRWLLEQDPRQERSPVSF